MENIIPDAKNKIMKCRCGREPKLIAEMKMSADGRIFYNSAMVICSCGDCGETKYGIPAPEEAVNAWNKKYVTPYSRSRTWSEKQ